MKKFNRFTALLLASVLALTSIMPCYVKAAEVSVEETQVEETVLEEETEEAGESSFEEEIEETEESAFEEEIEEAEEPAEAEVSDEVEVSGVSDEVDVSDIELEVDEGTESDWVSFSYINPLYEDILSVEDLPAISENTSASEADVVGSLEAAGEYVRSEMVSRVTEVSFTLETTEEPSGEMFSAIVDLALANTGVPFEGDYLLYQYGGYSAGYSCSYDGSVYAVTFSYSFVYYTTSEEEAAVNAALSGVYSELGLDDKTDFQKIFTIYSYICDHVVYDYDSLNAQEAGTLTSMHAWSAYGALMKGTSVCQGYAILLYRMLLDNGVDSRIISGIGGGGPHAWNIIQYGSCYYLADATWDAGSPLYFYFLKGSSNFPDHTMGSFEFNDYTSEAFLSQYPISETDCTGESTEGPDVPEGPDTPEGPDVPDPSDEPLAPGETLYVYNASDLLKLNSANPAVLMADIDMTGAPIEEYYYIVDNHSTPVKPGSRIYNYFDNVLDGNGHTISNLSAGLFYALGKNAVVKNTNFEFYYGETSDSPFADVFSGITDANLGTITDCTVKFTVRRHYNDQTAHYPYLGYTPGNYSTGVLVNTVFVLDVDISSDCADSCAQIGPGIDGEIINCQYNGSIRCHMGVKGGIVTSQNSGLIMNTDTQVEVEADTLAEPEWFGGITGANNEAGRIIRCCNRSNILFHQVTGYLGGIAGENRGLLNGDRNTGRISTASMSEYTASIAGIISGNSIIEFCLNEGQLVKPSAGSILVGNQTMSVWFDSLNIPHSPNDMVLYGNEDYSGSGLPEIIDRSEQFDVDYLDFYRRWSEYKADLLSYEYMELPIGTYISVPVNEKYAGKVHFREVTYHDSTDAYDVQRILCSKEGLIGIQSTENYDGWSGDVYKLIFAYTEDGLYDYMYLRFYDGCGSLAVSEHYLSNYNAGCIFTHGACIHKEEVFDPGKAATCTGDGLTEGTICAICGEILKMQEVIPAVGHCYDDGMIVKQPSCTENGEKVYTCSVCADSYQEDLPAFGHRQVVEEAIAATCTSDGSTAGIYCEICGIIISVPKIIPALGHSEMILPAVPATYTETGLTEGSMCSVCGEILKPQNVIAKKTLAAPSSVTVSAADNGIVVSWKKLSNATGYYVSRKAEGASGFTRIATISSNGTLKYTDTTASNGTKYVYQVRGYVTEGTKTVSGNSRQAAAIVFLSRPAAPKLSMLENGIKVTWTANAKATGYEIYRSKNGADYTLWKTISSGSIISASNTGLTNGAVYSYKIYAVKEVDGITYRSTFSNASSLTFVAKVKSPAISNTVNGLKVSWTANGKADGYQIYRSKGGAAYSLYKTIEDGTKVSYENTGLTNGVTYAYKIYAYVIVDGKKVKSVESAVVSTVRLNRVAFDTLTSPKANALKLTWTANAKADGYQIQYSTSSDFASVKSVTVSGGSVVTKTITSTANLLSGKTYYVRIRAYKSVDGTKKYSAWSVKKNVKVK